jgi:N-acyl-D-aspartate/D-glutamate deacylase
MPCDIKLSGGRVIDGTGVPAFPADVAITGDRISAVGDLDAIEARETLVCAGQVVAPGFIDIHSHSDWLVPGADCGALVEPFVRQGITTIVGGNCGFSPAPVTERSREAVQSASRLIADEEIDLSWETMTEFLDGLERTELPLNVAELVGHGAVRACVTGALCPDAPTGEEIEEMERLTKEALDAGCVGVSTGLGYAPGIFAKEPELTEFARWAAESDKLFTSHVRAYSWVSPVYQSAPETTPHNIRALQEMIRVAHVARARLQLSHLIFVGRNTWSTSGLAIECIEGARAEGLDVAFDAFPYTAGNTTASVLFPPEMLPHLEAMLENPEAMAGLRELGDRIFEQIGFSLEDVQIMDANAPALDRYNGLYVAEAAERAGMEIWEFYARLVVESRRNARVLNHTYSGRDGDETALRAVLAHPLCTIETDTFLTRNGHQNPASYGTFPRVLHTYVREGLFSLEEAVRKMTSAAAERLGWTDRGRIGAGCAADLVVFDAETLRDTATFEQPARFPTGIEHVFINGVQVVAGERYVPGNGAGRVIRS